MCVCVSVENQTLQNVGKNIKIKNERNLFFLKLNYFKIEIEIERVRERGEEFFI